MKDRVRPRNEDPGQRSRDRQHWHENDEMEKLQRKKFWIHIAFDIILVAATFFLVKDHFTKPLLGEITQLKAKIAELEK
jgi:hypothetical protein